MRGGVSGRISRGTRVRGRGISTSNHRLSPESVENLTFLSENQDTQDELMKKYQIKCSPDLNVDIQSAVEFTVGDGTRNIERTIYDDMSDAESDPDDEYEEEEGDEIMLEFMSTN